MDNSSLISVSIVRIPAKLAFAKESMDNSPYIAVLIVRITGKTTPTSEIMENSLPAEAPIIQPTTIRLHARKILDSQPLYRA